MPRPVVVNHFVRFAVKDPKWHILNALGVVPGTKVTGRGDGGGETLGVLVDGGEGSEATHGVAEAVDAVGVDFVFLGEFVVDEIENGTEVANGFAWWRGGGAFLSALE